MKVWNILKRFGRDQSGMETVEWAILAALIVAGLVTTISALGNNVLNKFTALQNATNGAGGGGGFGGGGFP
jgi:Flp pilus assembly pilin Flp